MMELTAFLHKLKFYRPKLTKQQVRTLKGQALADNIKGAEKGLSKILEGAVLNGKNNNGNASMTWVLADQIAAPIGTR